MPEPLTADVGKEGPTDGSPSGPGGRGSAGYRAPDLGEPMGVSSMWTPKGGSRPGEGLRVEVQGGGLACAPALSSWACHHAGCPHRSIHARLLVTHLMSFHGEGPER